MSRLVVGWLLWSALAFAQTPPEEENEGNVLRRMEYFYGPRRYPDAQFQTGARIRAFREVQRMEQAVRSGKVSLRGAGLQDEWKSIGPRPINFNPRNNDVVYIGGADGGVWKTTDGGTTWTPLTDQEASLSVGSIALDPSNPDIVYVGTGEQNFAIDNYNGAGILKSVDGGRTWTNIPGPFANSRIGAIAVKPDDGNILLAASVLGLYRSTDAGVTWKQVNAGTAVAVYFDSKQPEVAWAANGNVRGSALNGVYRSTDGGVTWTIQRGTGTSTIPSGTTAGRIEIVNLPTSPDSALAAVATPLGTAASLIDIYKTTDAGAHWTRLNAPNFCGSNGQCWYDLIVRPSPTDPNVIFAGGVNMIRSLNGGATWTTLPSNGGATGAPHVDNHAMVFSNDGRRFYSGNDGGVWSTDIFTLNNIVWKNLNATLSLTQYYPSLSIHPTNLNLSIGGAQDNGSHLFQGNPEWTLILGGDGGSTAIDPSAPNYAYVTTQDITLNRTYSFGGTNFGPGTTGLQSVVSGIDQNDRNAFIGTYILDPNFPQRMYYGTFRLYQSVDGAGLWTPISGDLTDAPGNTTDSQTYSISAIAVAPTDSNVIYTGSRSGAVFSTTDGGQNFTDRSAGLPVRAVTHITVDPFDSATVYACFSGTASATTRFPGHIYKSTDGGANWTDASGNFPNIPVNDLVIDIDLAGGLYAATDLGVMVSIDGGATWNPLGTGLPKTAVVSLVLHRPTRTLRAATHGRSMWDYALFSTSASQPTITSLTPSTMNAGSGAFALTIAGTNLGPGQKVFWNGQERPVTSAAATRLSVQIPASDIKGVGRAAIVVFNPSSGGGPSVPANFVIGPAPVIGNGGIVSAAFAQGGATGSPGALMSLFGANLTGALVQATSFPLPITLGGVTMLFNTTSIPLYFVSPNQINFQIPFSAGTTGTASIYIQQGLLSTTANLSMAAVTPTLFSINQQGSGQGSIRVASSATIAAPAGSIPGADTRAVKADDIIEVYGTGFGSVTPTVASGAAASSSPLSRTQRIVTATVGGIPASVIFSGLAPGVAGLYQINVTIPAGVTPGNAVPVILTVGNVQSNTVTIAVQ